MNILIVEDSITDATLLSRIVTAAGHTANVAHTVDEAKHKLGDGGVDVMLVDWVLPQSSGEILTRFVRDMGSEHYVYVMFVTSKTNDHLGQAFAAGADDFLRKPIHRDELLARLRAAERVHELEKRLQTRVEELESALRRLDVSSAMKGAKVAEMVARAPATSVEADPSDASLPKELTARAAWRSMNANVRGSLSEFLQGQFTDAPANAPRLDTEAFAASISLTNVKLGLEIELHFATDRASACSVGARLFGDDALEDAMLQDLLSEISNTAMGAVKASFAAEGEAFTAGLPSAARESAGISPARDMWRKSVLFVEGDVQFTLTSVVRRSPIREVTTSLLREGMILWRDLLDARGVLLLTSGTRITATLAERARKFAPQAKVEVIDSTSGDAA